MLGFTTEKRYAFGKSSKSSSVAVDNGGLTNVAKRVNMRGIDGKCVFFVELGEGCNENPFYYMFFKTSLKITPIVLVILIVVNLLLLVVNTGNKTILYRVRFNSLSPETVKSLLLDDVKEIKFSIPSNEEKIARSRSYSVDKETFATTLDTLVGCGYLSHRIRFTKMNITDRKIYEDDHKIIITDTGDLVTSSDTILKSWTTRIALIYRYDKQTREIYFQAITR